MNVNLYQSVQKSPVKKKDITLFVGHISKELKITGDVSIHIIGDTKMKRLNYEYRGKQKTTDVLAFPTGDSLVDEVPDIGDIFISVPCIKRQAATNNVSAREEFYRMLTHGVLHLAGYDHERETDAEEMFGLQEYLVAKYI